MTEQEIINWLGFGIAVAWFCKIGFHFVYLKAVDKSIKELSFISFYLKIENFLTSVLLVSPFFFPRTGNEGQEVKKTKRKAKIATYVLWTMFALTGFYLYNNPPRKDTTGIEEIKLVSFQSSFLRPSPIEDYLDTVGIREITRKERKGDTLEINIEFASSGCARFDGAAKVRGDSLILSYWITSDTSCTMLERYELKYTIFDHLFQEYKIGLKYRD